MVDGEKWSVPADRTIFDECAVGRIYKVRFGNERSRSVAFIVAFDTMALVRDM
jgi:hypothetical protein